MEEDRVKRLDDLGFVWYPYMSNWDECFEYAKDYYEKNGDLNVPKRYVCEDGYKLGLWLYTQRRVRKGMVNGNLSEEQIKRLDEIGMVWNRPSNNERFNEYVDAYVRFKERNGTGLVPGGYIDSDGYRLSAWTTQQKRQYREGKLSKDKVEKLNAVGFLWNSYGDQWDKQFEEAKAYYEKYGHLSISADYAKTHKGSLSNWLRKQRDEYVKEGHGNLDDEQVALLESIHIELRNRNDILFMKALAALKRYQKEHGDTLVPTEYITDDGYNLGSWVRHLKTAYKNGEVPEYRIKLLDEINMCWESTTKVNAEKYWNEMYEEAKKFYEEHGHFVVPEKYVTESGAKLYNWIAQQRRIRKGTLKHSSGLSDEKIAKLDALGMNWGRIE